MEIKSQNKRPSSTSLPCPPLTTTPTHPSLIPCELKTCPMKRWQNPNASNFVIIVIIGISKGAKVKNINYFKWMYPPSTTWRTSPSKALSTQIVKKKLVILKKNSPYKLHVRNHRFVSMFYLVFFHPKI
jgi:hypothetical protein